MEAPFLLSHPLDTPPEPGTQRFREAAIGLQGASWLHCSSAEVTRADFHMDAEDLNMG